MAFLRPITASLRCLNSPNIAPSASSSFCITRRAFTTTTSNSRQTPSHLTVPKDLVPDYPYGPFRTYKQRNEGLYGRAKIRFGNTVAEKYGNKSRTNWKPNRHTKRLWSIALQAFIRTRVTSRVLSTIDKLGGIDEYLLGSKTRRIKELGPAGWKLRWKIMQTPAVQDRFARQRAELGLSPPVVPISLPQELEGNMTPEDVMVEVDDSLARGDEFVIGDFTDGEATIIKREETENEDQSREAHSKQVPDIDMSDFLEEKAPSRSETDKKR